MEMALKKPSSTANQVWARRVACLNPSTDPYSISSNASYTSTVKGEWTLKCWYNNTESQKKYCSVEHIPKSPAADNTARSQWHAGCYYILQETCPRFLGTSPLPNKVRDAWGRQSGLCTRWWKQIKGAGCRLCLAESGGKGRAQGQLTSAQPGASCSTNTKKSDGSCRSLRLD